MNSTLHSHHFSTDDANSTLHSHHLSIDDVNPTLHSHHLSIDDVNPTLYSHHFYIDDVNSTLSSHHFSIDETFRTLGSHHFYIDEAFRALGSHHFSIDETFRTLGSHHFSIDETFRTLGSHHFSTDKAFRTLGTYYFYIKEANHRCGSLLLSKNNVFLLSGSYNRGERFEGQVGIFPIARAVEGCHEVSRLVGNLHLAVLEPFFIEDFACLGIEEAFAFGTEEIDGRRDGERQPGVAVGRGGKGQVGEGKDGPALAYAASVQVFRFDFHTRPGVSVAGFEQFHTRLLHGKAVVFEKIENRHGWRR